MSKTSALGSSVEVPSLELVELSVYPGELIAVLVSSKIVTELTAKLSNPVGRVSVRLRSKASAVPVLLKVMV